jgi:hypothetical protein
MLESATEVSMSVIATILFSVYCRMCCDFHFVDWSKNVSFARGAIRRLITQKLTELLFLVSQYYYRLCPFLCDCAISQVSVDYSQYL